MLWCVLIGPCQPNQVAVVSIRLVFKLRVVFSKRFIYEILRCCDGFFL